VEELSVHLVSVFQSRHVEDIPFLCRHLILFVILRPSLQPLCIGWCFVLLKMENLKTFLLKSPALFSEILRYANFLQVILKLFKNTSKYMYLLCTAVCTVTMFRLSQAQGYKRVIQGSLWELNL